MGYPSSELSRTTALISDMDYQTQIANLQKTRSVVETIQQSTLKIYEDIQVARKNNEVVLNEASEARDVVEGLGNKNEK
ncbi:DEHA2G02442p [Debaryomyces hansenii CBS767]|uniref:DEHA2G02442p n=1 Tax=Debaryomyces hansenii (strain ATCC 36239 / CBS 767 / BCRC 21394 / JCM 1990 / NBRC 0083 / IGC 2968) TaxID=284592 RepID=Q6BJH2_DEBHA|nr:DEHA2G02442p [Debaryomyces hansenii CBS767]CAG90097.2 DEHA2G02442p [Debaryomyces hansenii CBS767]|eukprot:XP_461649.2 DEHA2G02442p [Debaryomyces hansenii CBS767]